MANENCVLGAQNKEAIRNLEKRSEELHAVDEQQWEAINTLRNRLPHWATLVISLLALIVGILATLAFESG